MDNIYKLLLAILPHSPIYAHCDVPCGIYDPKPAQIAAATVLKMVQKINELPGPDTSSIESVTTYHNAMTRFVLTKEEHARICKHELLVLWSDYFKPEHLRQFPNLHETFWKAAKLCSKNKQEVSAENAQALVVIVDEIAEIFKQSKNAK